MENIKIRLAKISDISALYAAQIEAASTPPEKDYFEHCLQEQSEEKRLVFVAAEGTAIRGQAMLNLQPPYAPFRRLGIPEIQDLMVVPACRRQGLGEKLIAACEQAARERSIATIGIGVGLDSSFGAAQRLYIRLGYVPDGAGVTYDNVVMRKGEMKPLDDLFSLKMTKDL